MYGLEAAVVLGCTVIPLSVVGNFLDFNAVMLI